MGLMSAIRAYIQKNSVSTRRVYECAKALANSIPLLSSMAFNYAEKSADRNVNVRICHLLKDVRNTHRFMELHSIVHTTML